MIKASDRTNHLKKYIQELGDKELERLYSKVIRKDRSPLQHETRLQLRRELKRRRLIW